MAKKSRTKRATRQSQAHRILNLVPSRNTQGDWGPEAALSIGAMAAAPLALPPSVDLRAPWWKIGDQGSTGSCVGWASTDGVARYHFVKANRLGNNELLSPRFTWMASKETDQFVTRPETMIEEAGTSLKAAVDILRKYGAAPETALPFKINTLMYTGSGDAFFATAATRKIAGYFNLQRNVPSWRSWLATKGPILVGLAVDATWMNATATNGLLDNFQPTTVLGGHAVCAVGYRVDGRIILRNSWGTGWGQNGFAFASEAYINAAFFNESYGVSV